MKASSPTDRDLREATEPPPGADPPKRAKAVPRGPRLSVWPRWPALLSTTGVALLHFVLPDSLRFGPPWLVLSGTALLLTATVVAGQVQRRRLNQLLGVGVLIWLTGSMGVSLVALLRALPAHTESPRALLFSATVLWVANVLVFAVWYWRLDGGGPSLRAAREGHPSGAFLFPQMQLRQVDLAWKPGFVDYLFLAFTTSAAFSPTDTPVLSRWAKIAVMVQAVIAFLTVAVLVARGVGAL